MALKKFLTLMSLLGLLTCEALAGGGSSDTSQQALDRYEEADVHAWTDRLNNALYEKHANVAIIARSGRARGDLPDGVNYTHAAFAVFEPVKDTRTGEIGWSYTCYNLYQGFEGDKSRSFLAQDMTWEMVVGSAEGDIGVLIPLPKLQEDLFTVLHSETPGALHVGAYSLLANPYDERYDNCITWMLKVLFSAIYATTDPETIQQSIEEWFTPTPIHLGAAERLAANFVSGITFRDHEGTVQTATFGSLKTFLEEQNLLKDSFSIHIDNPEPQPL